MMGLVLFAALQICLLVGRSSGTYQYRSYACSGEVFRHSCTLPHQRIVLHKGILWGRNSENFIAGLDGHRCEVTSECSEWCTSPQSLQFISKAQICCDGRYNCTIQAPHMHTIELCDGRQATWLMMSFECIPKHMYKLLYGHRYRGENASREYCMSEEYWGGLNSSTLTTIQPSKTATTIQPSKTATTIQPSKTATTIQPSKTATTIQPSKTATTIQPSKTATTIQPSKTATTIHPSKTATTSTPDAATAASSTEWTKSTLVYSALTLTSPATIMTSTADTLMSTTDTPTSTTSFMTTSKKSKTSSTSDVIDRSSRPLTVTRSKEPGVPTPSTSPSVTRGPGWTQQTETAEDWGMDVEDPNVDVVTIVVVVVLSLAVVISIIVAVVVAVCLRRRHASGDMSTSTSSTPYRKTVNVEALRAASNLSFPSPPTPLSADSLVRDISPSIVAFPATPTLERNAEVTEVTMPETMRPSTVNTPEVAKIVRFSRRLETADAAGGSNLPHTSAGNTAYSGGQEMLA